MSPKIFSCWPDCRIESISHWVKLVNLPPLSLSIWIVVIMALRSPCSIVEWPIFAHSVSKTDEQNSQWKLPWYFLPGIFDLAILMISSPIFLDINKMTYIIKILSAVSNFCKLHYAKLYIATETWKGRFWNLKGGIFNLILQLA